MSETSLELVQPTRMEVARASEPLGVEEILAQVNLIQSVMHRVMKDGEHYGTIPGCGDKKTLLQPGAQKLTMTFRLAPEYAIQEIDLARGHKEYRVICTLKSIQSGTFVGQGVGCCSSMESKYRWRGGARKCPKCGKETIIKGKAEYGGGWLCYGKKGGCGAKWNDGAAEIESQSIDKVENENPADTFNTVLKMAKKRAFVDATITATAASDIFTQDIGDDESDEPVPARKSTTPAEEVPDGGFENAKPVRQPSLPHLKPTSTATTPLAPAPTSPFAFKNDRERKAWLDAHLRRCKLKLVSDLEKGDPQAAVEFMKKAGHLLPTETAISEANELTLFPSVPHSPGESEGDGHGIMPHTETDGDWRARVNEAVAKDALAIKRAFEAFQQGDQIPDAEAGRQEAEPEQDHDPVPAGALTLNITVEHVTTKQGQSARGPWTRWSVKDQNDLWYSTFSARVGKNAEQLKGQKATIFFTETERGNDLHKIIPV